MKRIKVKSDVYISTMDDLETEELALKAEIYLNSLGPIDLSGGKQAALRFHFREENIEVIL